VASPDAERFVEFLWEPRWTQESLTGLVPSSYLTASGLSIGLAMSCSASASDDDPCVMALAVSFDGAVAEEEVEASGRAFLTEEPATEMQNHHTRSWDCCCRDFDYKG
jgi:hypothetical protein